MPKPVLIALLEDDYHQAEATENILRDVFHEPFVDRHYTLSAFIEALRHYEENTPPAIFILDMMLPWTYPSEEMTEPPVSFDYGRGGMFAVEALRSHSRLADVPCVFHTAIAVPTEQLPRRTVWASKADFDSLHLVVRSVTIATHPDAQLILRPSLGRHDDILEAKPGLAGFSVDLRRAYRRMKAQFTE
jgi:CheY-like chemotaxis protein